MLVAIAFALTTSSGVPVDVGRWQPADFPNLIKLERTLPHAEMTRRVENMFDKGTCRIANQNHRRFDVTIPYAALMEHSGKLKKVVVGEVGCPSLELLVGQVVISQASRGDFKIQHISGDQWYTSELYFAKGEPQTALSDPDKVVCEQSEPVVGSRLQRKRRCMTKAEWQTYKADRAQLGRDIQNNPAAVSTVD
jgi:hypothetical protein